MQVTVSRRQHIRAAVGYRKTIHECERAGRRRFSFMSCGTGRKVISGMVGDEDTGDRVDAHRSCCCDAVVAIPQQWTAPATPSVAARWQRIRRHHPERPGRLSEGNCNGISILGPMHGLSYRDEDQRGRGQFDRIRVACEHHGELVARSLLAGKHAPGDDGSSARPNSTSRMSARSAIWRLSGWRTGMRAGIRMYFRAFLSKGEREEFAIARLAQDGVTCSVCHQIEKEGLGTEATFNGNVVVSKAVREDERPEYGPFDPDHGHQTMMHSSTAGYLPVQSDHMRDAALCGSCHTLIPIQLWPMGRRCRDFLSRCLTRSGSIAISRRSRRASNAICRR